VERDKLRFLDPGIDQHVEILDIKADIYQYEKEFVSKYENYLHDCDLVWSDNLLFPLKYTHAFVMTGSFLWSQVVGGLEYEAELMREKKPVVVGNKYFATPLLKQSENFKGVGIYDYFGHRKAQSGHGVLLSCGRTERARAYFEDQLSEIRKMVNDISKDIEIYVEPDFLNRFEARSNIKEATFDHRMYQRIGAAVIRPGIGTISDTLSSGARIFSFREDDNFELKYNMTAIESLRVGQGAGSIPKALNLAVQYLSDQGQQRGHSRNIAKLNFNGVEETVEEIRRMLE
jgi:hypothetical protein